MKPWIPTASIIVMAIALLTAPFFPPTIAPWVAAFAEAGLVGGLADWFAVTALFRSPLGLPIPHTAVLVKEKKRIGIALANFVRDTFLNESAVKSFLEDHHVAQRFGTLFDDEASVRATLNEIIQPEELIGIIQEKALSDSSLTSAFSFAENRLISAREIFSKLIPLPWYVPAFVEPYLSEKLHQRLLHALREAKDDLNHPLRLELHRIGSGMLSQLGHDNKLGDLLTPLLQKGARRISPDAFNQLFLRITNVLFPALSRELPALTVRLFDNLSDERLVARIESTVGRDLQWIRINGTLVGGIIGVVLYAIEVHAPRIILALQN